jgi:tryptophan 2,3-dioxygenase
MGKYSCTQDVLDALRKWEEKQTPTTPMHDEVASNELIHKGVSYEEQAEKLAALTLNGEAATPRVLASYADLHGLDRIDEAKQGMDLSDNPKAANVRSVLQTCEIALLNIRDLSNRIVTDINAENIGDAEEKYRWVSAFQKTLQSLGMLESSLPVAGKCTEISVTDSPSCGTALEDIESIHKALAGAGFVDANHISHHNLHDSGRNLTHQAFVDTAYTDIWMQSLRTVHIPNVQLEAGEDSRAFYARFVGTEALNLAVNELDQTGDNFLRQFRAYHQMSEILVGQVNRLVAQSIHTILSPEGNLMEASETMRIALQMIDIVNQNVEPILRNLSVNKYQDIRGSLGITSGSHSSNIKKGLFSPLYELFTEAVKFRVMDSQPFTEEGLKCQIEQIAENPTKNHETHDYYVLLTQANALHLSLKTWRDLHMQFVKTQIGLAPEGRPPTASISGAPNAVKSAHTMRQVAHGGQDVIAPIYEGLLGKGFMAVSPFSSVFRRGEKENFVDAMLGHTAKVMEERSAAVQNRVHHTH